MSMDFGERARALVGVPFRPQGRSVETGLDCVGLTLAVFGIARDLVRSDYQLRGEHAGELQAQIGRFFRRIAAGAGRSGDLMLSRVGPEQQHLSILTDRGLVHADARLRRVVERPGRAPWPVIAMYRRRTRSGEC